MTHAAYAPYNLKAMLMKKFIRPFSALIAAITLALGLSLFGCAGDDRKKPDGKIENGRAIVYAFTADTDGGSMLDYMNALKAAGDLAFEGGDGEYGYYITSVLGVGSKVDASTANSYSGWDWAVYTTVTTVDGVTYSGTENFSYNGITFYKASYGVSGIPCVSGESYALVYELSTMRW